jgi:hypothetical protein
MKLDGTGGENIAAVGGSTMPAWPSFAPDGKRAAYIKDSRIYRISGIKGYIDCNNNNIPDACDLPSGTAPAYCGYFCSNPADCGQAGDCNSNLVPDTCEADSDGDGHINACEDCDFDPLKVSPGVCGCGVPDVDSDGDLTLNCQDFCPHDPLKVAPGWCDCGVPDTDSDMDGLPDCDDGCKNDPTKFTPETCGCGVAEWDSDFDGTVDCVDGCLNDSAKIAAGICGCGVADVDADSNGILDCLYNGELKNHVASLQALVKKLKVAKTKTAKATLKANTAKINSLLSHMLATVRNGGSAIQTTKAINLLSNATSMSKTVKKALKVTDRKFATNKKNATKALAAFLKLLV